MPLSEKVPRTCVIVSPYFPPSTLAGVHRARHLAKHLVAAGWVPVVICVDEAFHEERLDPGLARLVPATVEVVKVRATSPRLTRLIGLGEISLRGFMPLRRQLFSLLETRLVGAVFITGAPYFPMLLAREVKRRFGVPVVLDFQDPWVSAWGATQPRLSKSGLSHALATVLEPRALRGASYITSVSEAQNAQLCDRYPWLNRQRMAAIPIGSDPEDFEASHSEPGHRGYLELDRGYFNISYVGTIWPSVVPTVRAFLRAVAALRREDLQLYRRLRFHFIGTTANSNDTMGLRVIPLARDEGVEDVIREVPRRLPYLEALSFVVQSDASLMLGSNEPHYTASKIYSALMSGRPYLSVFHRASSAHEILLAAGGGVTLAFSTSEELDALEEDICRGLAQLVVAPTSLGRADPAAYAPFSARVIARRFAAIFDQLDRERGDAQRCV